MADKGLQSSFRPRTHQNRLVKRVIETPDVFKAGLSHQLKKSRD